jgi:hypothetical protein
MAAPPISSERIRALLREQKRECASLHEQATFREFQHAAAAAAACEQVGSPGKGAAAAPVLPATFDDPDAGGRRGAG